MNVVGSVHTGFHVAELHQAFLGIPGSEHGLELIEYRNVDKSAIEPRNADPGTAHLCLLVDDVPALHARLAAQGVASLSAPVVPTMGPNVGRRAVYLKDPDGIRIELLQSSGQTFAHAGNVAAVKRSGD
jgi:lactoylglutathione lyase